MALTARVHNGRLVLDEPTDLPEGQEVQLAVVGQDGDRELEAALEQSEREFSEGKGREFFAAIGELRARS